MKIENLIAMANQIGSFYESMPDRKIAESDIAGHIKKFWEPRMRRALLAHVDTCIASNEPAGFTPIVDEAIQLNRALLEG